MLAGCGRSGDAGADVAHSETIDIDSFKTVGDLPQSVNFQIGFGENYYVYVFEVDETYYRAIAEMPAEVTDVLWTLDYMDEAFEQKAGELVAPLEISRIENLNEQIPSQAELDQLVGKTGQDLLDDGWYVSGYSLDDMEFWMNHDPFSYMVIFDGSLENADDLDADAAIRSLTVQSVTYMGIGDATNVEDEVG